MPNRGHKNSSKAQSKGIAHENAKEKGGSYLRPPVADAHPVVQTASHIKPSLLPKGIPLHPNGNAIQMKPIAAVEGANNSAVENEIFLDKKLVKVKSFWTADVGEKADRNTLIGHMASKAAEIGATVEGMKNWTEIEGNIEKPDVHDTIDPFMLRVTGKYDVAKHDMALDYHFGNSWMGYVIKVVDAGKGINQAMKPIPHKEIAELKLEDSHFSNVHRARGGNAAIAGADDADSVTKLAGEGARWNCIRTGLPSVADTTKIYTNENSDGKVTEEMRYVTFPVLWKSWAATFERKFGIPDEKVIEKLKDANVTIKTKDGQKAHAVGKIANKDLVHGRDISVDHPKPNSSDDLKKSDAFKFLYFKKKDPPMIQTASLAAEQATFKQKLSAKIGAGNVHHSGYAGGNKFVALATLPGAGVKLDPVGYVALDNEHVQVKFPRYRKEAAKVYAKENEASGKAIAAGTDAYKKEKQDEYERRIALTAKALVAHQSDDLGGMDEEAVEERIKAVLKWTDVDTAIPNVGAAINKHILEGTFLEAKDEDVDDGGDGEEAPAPAPAEPEAKLSAKDLKKLKKQKQKAAKELERDRRGPGGKRKVNRKGGGGNTAGSDTE